MKVRVFGLALICALFASVAKAELMVINGRYVVAKEDIRGFFYRDRDGRTVFDVRWSDWSTRYQCQDAYDRTRVTAASLNLVIQVSDALSLDFGDYLAGEGFTECQKF
ncbi:MAG: hypothetical protein AAF999_11295 [Pseudomonadota bacterium]